jgi:hypothetical protein
LKCMLVLKIIYSAEKLTQVILRNHAKHAGSRTGVVSSPEGIGFFTQTNRQPKGRASKSGRKFQKHVG